MTGPGCVFCGRRPVDLHHLTGRPSPDAEYFDVALVVALCRKHHSREHVLLADKDLEWLPAGVEPIVHRLRRVLLFAERCSDFRRPLTLEFSSAAGLVLVLVEAIAALGADQDGRSVA